MVSKLMVAVMFVLLIFAGVSAQEGCNRTVSDAPPISGLKVGMSFEEVERALGTVAKIKPFKNGEGTIYLSFAEQTPPASLSGIGTLWLRLYKNRVYQLEVFYSGTKEGESISNFTN